MLKCTKNCATEFALCNFIKFRSFYTIFSYSIFISSFFPFFVIAARVAYDSLFFFLRNVYDIILWFLSLLCTSKVRNITLLLRHFYKSYENTSHLNGNHHDMHSFLSHKPCHDTGPVRREINTPIGQINYMSSFCTWSILYSEIWKRNHEMKKIMHAVFVHL